MAFLFGSGADPYWHGGTEAIYKNARSATLVEVLKTNHFAIAGTDGKHAGSTLDAGQLGLQEQIRQALMRYFPEGCRYNKSFSMTVNASRSDTGFVRYATIPIAMCPVDWKGR